MYSKATIKVLQIISRADAFGAVHRAHASTAGVADYLPAYCGFLVEKELTALGGAMDDPKRAACYSPLSVPRGEDARSPIRETVYQKCWKM